MVWSVALFPILVALLFMALASDKKAQAVSANTLIVIVFGTSALLALGIGAAISFRAYRRWLAEAEQAGKTVRIEGGAT